MDKAQAIANAEAMGMELNEYLEFYDISIEEGKTNGPTGATPPMGQKGETAAGDSSSADTSLELSNFEPYLLTSEDLEGTEEDVQERIQSKLQAIGIRTDQTGWGDAIMLQGQKRDSQGHNARTSANLKDKDAALEQLNNFIAQNGDIEASEKAKVGREDIIKGYYEATAPAEVSEEEAKGTYVSNKIKKFNKLETISAPRMDGSSMFVADTKKDATEKDFETPEEYKEYLEWKDTGIVDPSEETVKSFREELIYNNKVRSGQKYIDNLRGEDKDAVSTILSKEKVDLEYRANNLDNELSGLQMVSNELAYDIEQFNANPTSKEEMLSLQQRAVALNRKSEEFNTFAQSLQSEETQDLLIAVDNFSKDYSLFNKLGVDFKSTATQMGYGAAQLITAVAYGAQTASAPRIGKSLDTALDELDEAWMPVLERGRKESQLFATAPTLDQVKDADDLFDWIGSTAIGSIPSLSMAFAGTAAMPLFFFSGYGGKASEITLNQYDATLRLKTNSEKLEQHNSGEIILPAEDLLSLEKQIQEDNEIVGLPTEARLGSAVLAGASEVLFEKVGTMAIFKGASKAVNPTSLRGAGLKFVKASNQEGMSEAATQIANNFGDWLFLGDTEKNLFEGIGEAYAGGVLIGGPLSLKGTMPAVYEYSVSVLMDKRTREEIENKLKALSALTGIDGLQNALDPNTDLESLSPEVKKLAQEVIGEIDLLKEGIANRLGGDLTNEQVIEVGALSIEMQQINKRFVELAKKGVGGAELAAAEKTLRAKFDALAEKREAILTSKETGPAAEAYNSGLKVQMNAKAGYNAMLNNQAAQRAQQSNREFDNLNPVDKSARLAEARDEASQTGEDVDAVARRNYFKARNKKALEADRVAAEKFAASAGVDVEIETLTQAEWDARGLDDAEGMVEGNKITINIDKAALNGRVGVYSHEVLHSIVAQKIDNGDANTAGKNLLTYLEKNSPDTYVYVKARLDTAYEGDAQYYEEAMNALSDYIAEGNTLETKSLAQVQNFINGLFGKNSGVKIDDAASTYSFIATYANKNKNSKTEAILQAITRTAREDKTEPNELEKKFSKTLTPDQNASVMDMLSKRADRIAEAKKVAEKFGVEVQADAVQQRLETKIREQLSPLIGKIVTNRTKALYDPIAPEQRNNVSREEFQSSLRTEIEALAFEEFKEGKQDIEKFLVNRAFLRSNNLASRLGIESVATGGIKKDIDAAKGMAVQEETAQVAETPMYKSLIRRRVVSEEGVATIKDKMKVIVRTLKSKLNAEVSKNVTVKPWVNEARLAFGKQFDIILKKEMGGKKDGELRKFLLRNKAAILENMTTTYLMTAMPNAIQKKVDGQWTSDWQGKKIDRETTSTDSAGRTSGAELVRRLPKAAMKISDADFLANVLQPDGNPIRGRKESLAKAIAEELSFEVFFEQIQDKDSDIRKALEDNQQALGSVIGESVVAEVTRDLERGNVKKSFSSFTAEQHKAWFNNSSALSDQIAGMKGNYTLKGLKMALTMVHGENLDKDQIAGVAKIMFNLLKPFQGEEVTTKFKGKTNFREWLGDVAQSKDFEETIVDIVGADASVAELFRDPNNVAAARSLVIAELIKMDPATVMSFAPGTFANSGKIGEYRPGSNERGTHRSDLFENKADLVAELKAAKPGVDWDNVKPAYNATANVTKGHINGTFDIAKDKANADAAWETLNTIMKSIATASPNMQAMIMATMNSGTNTVLRVAAPVTHRAQVMPGKKASDYRYEHALPARVVLSFLYQRHVRKDQSIDLDALKKDYEVAIIPVAMDKVIGKTGYSKRAVAGYKPGFTARFARYFNPFTLGKIQQGLVSYETGEVIGEAHARAYAQKISIDEAQHQKAVESTAKFSRSPRKARVFDFDDTLARSNSKVLYAMPNGKKGKLTATEFAKKSEALEAAGAAFDFSEFNKVVDGKKGPLFELAKFISESPGERDMFVLTARPQDAALPIHKFLKGLGLNIPLENITGLANGAPKAKADWMLEKFEQGYNDFYFADDATKNVKAVKEALKTIDAKSKVQVAKFSKSVNNELSNEFNNIVERTKGVAAYKVFSKVQAELRGAKKGRFKFFIAPGADDFRGLVNYAFAGKGKQGEKDMSFFEEKLLTPYFKGVAAIESARQAIRRDYSAINKVFKSESKMMKKKIGDSQFTYDHALRVYLWEKQGTKVPGISKRDAELLREAMNQNPNLKSYADALLVVSKRSEWMEPSDYWPAQTVLSDLNSMTEKIGRKKFLEEFIANSDAIFTAENLNKIEAVYGKAHREALEDSLYAMKNGSNRPSGNNRQVNKWLNWINGSTGAIMFFNRRSALLQMLSFTNFTNWTDNNPLMQAKAFANQKQYWSDFAMIFNSDKLKERRSGLKTDVSESELANVAQGANGKPQAILNYLLKIGFTPTQIADSFAIATGGAMFYRNRVNSYLKEGKTQKQAEEAAFLDFSKRSDEAQQSSDPALVSQQQRSVLGRLVLAFANTPMQYTRLMKKAALDLINGRGSVKENISKIAYYGVVQNFIFSALQNALFALAFDDEDDEEMTDNEREKLEAKEQTRISRTINSMIDTVLRGSGIYGAVASTVKNVIMEYQKQEEKGFTGDHAYTILQALNISPPIGSKVRKIYSAIQTRRFEKDNIEARGWALTANGKLNLGPNYSVLGSLVSGVANVPLDRVVDELRSVTEALDERNKAWQRIALALGWKTWDVGAVNEEAEEIKAEAKKKRKAAGIEKAKKTKEDKEEDAQTAWEKEQRKKFLNPDK